MVDGALQMMGQSQITLQQPHALQDEQAADDQSMEGGEVYGS